ncbi:MAG TPA: OPT/YSL family transporter, partial [Planctomycetota bacterium]|nr:OPT/YSL family transporter [Planctomycetota bacterium]
MSENEIRNTLPENAYRELKPGETYVPMVPPHVDAPELTPRSIAFGIAMNILWAAAATYIALKVGQGIETAIPISILAVGLSGLLLRLGFRRSTIIENINILAISTTSGMVAGGTVFTMPAIYILGIDQHLALGNGAVFLHIFLVPLFGAVLGVIFLVPFRRFFVKEMHGKLPFPEGTATNEILVTGQGGGAGALTLIWSFAVSSLYTLGTAGLKLWSEVFTTGKIEVAWKETAGAAAPLEAVQRSVVMPAFAGDFWTDLTDRVKAVFSMGTGAEFIGLGFIMGAHYAAIIVAGSILSYLVIVPLLAPLSLEALQSISSGIESTSAEAIFKAVSKNVGIGCIFAAGVLSILKMSPIIMTALREGLGGLFRGARTTGRPERTDRDIAYPGLVVIGLLTAVALGVYFRFFVLADMPGADLLAAGSVLLALAAAFFFITVSAWAIATISVTPISGMTVTTIIVTALALAAAGLQKGPAGQFAVLLIGGVVASSLSVAGTLVTEFKLGYWAGATPRRIQWSCMIACV